MCMECDRFQVVQIVSPNISKARQTGDRPSARASPDPKGAHFFAIQRSNPNQYLAGHGVKSAAPT